MKNLVEYINENLTESSSDIDNVIKKCSKNTKDKKIFSAFIDFLKDKKEDYTDVEDFEDFVRDEAFTDFLETYKDYGIRNSIDDYIDEMNFDEFIESIIPLLNVI